MYGRKRAEDILFDALNTVFLVFLAFITLYPFWNLAVVSINDSLDTVRGGLSFWPRVFTWKNYSVIFENRNLLWATGVTLVRTVLGTVVSVFCTMMLAYTLSRKEYVFRNFISVLFVFTMYFSGGLIPGYLLIRSLGLVGNFWVYIVPGILSAFNLVVARSFIEELPESFVEAARIDNAGEFRIFLTIILPLSMPVVAVLSLFIAVGHWNDWFTTFLYAPYKKELSTLQFELMKVLQAAGTTMTQDAGSMVEKYKNAKQGEIVTPGSIRAAMTIVATIPILLVYPFLQKYFAAGFTVGGIKE